MTFYGQCLQAEPHFTPFSPGPPEVAAGAKTAPDRILHAELATGPVVLMASDTLPGMYFPARQQFLDQHHLRDATGIGEALCRVLRKGQGQMPLHDAFWGGRFGMLRINSASAGCLVSARPISTPDNVLLRKS